MKRSVIPICVLLAGLCFAGCKKEPEDFGARAREAESAGNTALAIQHYERATRDRPGDPDLREKLIELLLQEGRDDQALPHLMLLARQRRDDGELLVRTIRLMLEFGGWKESKDFYEMAPTPVQKKPAVQEVYAELLVREAKFEEALKVLGDVIESPDSPAGVVRSARLRRGRLFHQMGRSDAALTEFNALLKSQPDDSEALLLRANLYMAERQYAEAKAGYEGLLKSHPDEQEAWLGLASLAVQEGRTAEAIQSYEKALLLNPKDADVLFWLAELHFERGDREALEALKGKAQGRQWERELFLGYLRGLQHMQAEHYREALKEFERLQPVLTGYPGLFDKTGLCYLKLGDPVQAEAAFSKLPHDETVQEQVWSALGRGYLSITNYARAVRWLEVAKGKERIGPLAQAQFGLGDLEAAYRNAQLWLKEEPTSLTARLIAGEAARKLEMDQHGRDHFEQIAAAEPDSPAGIYARAQLLVGSNQLAGAAALLDQQPDLVKNQPGPSLLKAEISLRLDKVEEAEKQLLRTLELDPRIARAHALLGMIARTRKDLDAAEKHFAQALAVDPLDRIALMGQGWLAQEKEDYGRAAELFDKASGLKRPEPEAALLWTLAEFARGDSKRALQAAERAVRLSPTNAFAKYLEVRANMATGQWNRARDQAAGLHRQHPAYAPGEHAQALLALSTNGTAQALQHVQRGLQLQATNLLLQPLEVELLRLDGQSAVAAEKLARLKRDFPAEPDTFLAEMNLLLDRKAVAEARELALKGLVLNPRDGRLQQRLLDAFVRYGQEQDAAPVMEGLLKNDSANIALRFICARLREVRGDWAAAEDHYRTILKTDPQNVATLNNLGIVVGRDEKRRDEAIKLAQRAYVLDGKNPAVADTLATLLLAEGDARQALLLLETARIQAPKSIDIRLHLIEALLTRGMTGEARKEFEVLTRDLPGASQRSEYQTLASRLQGTGPPPGKAN